MTAIRSDFSFEEAPPEPGVDDELPPGIGVYALAWRRLRRNRVSMFFGLLFLIIVVLCLLAPVYSQDIAHMGQNAGSPTNTITINGKQTFVTSTVGVPIGPTWNLSQYFLGADELGRNLAVRLLYGGRNSLVVGTIGMLITMMIGTSLGILAGFYRGLADTVVSRLMDVIWAYPAVLLGITLDITININGLGPFHHTTLVTTGFVVGFLYIPYVVRPIRAQVLTLREREFVDAARQQGLSNIRIMFTELLPNLSSEIIVFIPLILANAILTEAALDYLGAGLQPPTPSWGSIISEGLQQFPAAFHLVLIPGIMLVLAVMSINIFGDGVRDALDPRSKVRS
ncbi:MAG: ABC transporter permease [Solirubrobacteraceae bacterium]